MKVAPPIIKRGRAELWTVDRLEKLDRQELTQLRANAERLAESQLVEMCSEVLKKRPARGGGAAAAAKQRARLMPRTRAFQARGVWLQAERTSWSGIRKSDGEIVFAVWAGAVESKSGGCQVRLWAPNENGSRPWSDTAAGLERLQHCETAIERGVAEGILIHGTAPEGHPPEERAQSVHGADPETVLRFKVEKRGAEYWATWGTHTPQPM